MIVYDYASGLGGTLPVQVSDKGIFVICNAHEVEELGQRFGWDESTAAECMNLDETVRYTCYDGYDFVSLIHIEYNRGKFIQREINLFFSRYYLVLVLPEILGKHLESLKSVMSQSAENEGGITWLYYLVLSGLAADLSGSLEALEDDMESLAERVSADYSKELTEQMEGLRRSAYTAKKILRALSYLGEDILTDQNSLLPKKLRRYFNSIDTRLKKLYDFSSSLYGLSAEILNTCDSKLAIKMNDMVNKLTVITLFFGPLTVITGVYGMNFTHMPGLSVPHGFPMVMGLMAGVTILVYAMLKKWKWL